MRGRPVTPSGMVPPPHHKDAIPPPHGSVSVASVTLASGVGVGVGIRDSPTPSVGHVSDSFKQDLGQSRVRDAPDSSYVHNVSAHDAHNVASSVSSSYSFVSTVSVV